MKEKKLPKSDPLPPVREEEQPFALPAGWAWARLGEVVYSRDHERVPLWKEQRARRVRGRTPTMVRQV